MYLFSIILTSQLCNVKFKIRSRLWECRQQQSKILKQWVIQNSVTRTQMNWNFGLDVNFSFDETQIFLMRLTFTDVRIVVAKKNWIRFFMFLLFSRFVAKNNWASDVVAANMIDISFALSFCLFLSYCSVHLCFLSIVLFNLSVIFIFLCLLLSLFSVCFLFFSFGFLN